MKPMRTNVASSLVLASLLMLGCSPAPKSQAGDSGSSGDTLAGGGSGGTGDTSSTGGTGTPVGTAGPTYEISEKMTLGNATARLGGRFGDELIVEVEGTSDAGLFASVGVVLLNSDGSGAAAFDSEWDGTLDSASGRLVPSPLPTETTFSTRVVLEGASRFSELSTAEVMLFDRENKGTESRVVQISKPVIVSLGESCDPDFVESRCRQGYSCAGDPAVCVDGTTPTITKGAYLSNSAGPQMRLVGTDPDDDVVIVRVDFLSSNGSPVMMDLDGDEETDASSFDVEVGLANADGGFLFVNQAGLTFADDVPKVALTAIDSRGNESNTITYGMKAPTVQSAGESCNLYGFDTCEEDSVCLPNNQGTAGYCTTATQAETNSCNAAKVWNLGKDPLKLTGVASGHSVWEDSSGCFGPTAVGRPESVIKLRLPEAVASLTLTTAVPETQVDTAILVLPACSSSSEVLGCDDDSEGYASTLTLTDVAAGDYYVIVEALDDEGGSFGLQATLD